MKSLKLHNSLTWQLVGGWIWVAVFTAALISIAIQESSLFLLFSYFFLGVVVCALLCSCLKNTYEIKDGHLHIHEISFWFLHYDYSIPINNIDKAALIWQMKFPFYTLRLWVGSAEYTLNADENVSKLILSEVNKIKKKEERK